MTISIIEDAVIQHLKRVIQGVQVQSFPAKPQDYVLQTADAALLIRFVEEKPKTDALGKAGLTELHFDINIVARQFTSQKGVYVFYQAVADALRWVQFGSEAGKASGLVMQFRGGRFDSYDSQKGLWFYAMRFTIDTPFAPLITPATLVKEITLADISQYPDDRNNPDKIVIS